MDLLDQDNFDGLLTWLDPDRDRGAVRYEMLRLKLIMFFEGRGCASAAWELADRVLDLVARKLSTGTEIRVRPESYCYGVARKVILENSHQPAMVPILMDPPVAPAAADEDSVELLARMDTCLRRLAPQERELILHFYDGNGHGWIEERKRMAQEMGISRNALGIRAYGIRCRLQAYLREWIEREPAEIVLVSNPYTIDRTHSHEDQS